MKIARRSVTRRRAQVEARRRVQVEAADEVEAVDGPGVAERVQGRAPCRRVRGLARIRLPVPSRIRLPVPDLGSVCPFRRGSNTPSRRAATNDAPATRLDRHVSVSVRPAAS